MNKIFIGTVLLTVLSLGMFFTACQDEDICQINQNEETNPIDYVSTDTLGVNNLILRIPQNTHLSKGYCIDQEGLIETGIAFFGKKKGKTFKTMKVYRQADPSKYFYIMLTNLDIPYPFDDYLKDSTQVINSLCAPYANNYANVKEYGLLYDKYSAEQICNYIFMKLPLMKNGKPVVKNGNPIMKSVKGRFMKRADLADLLECESDSIFKVGLNGVSEYLDSDELFDTKFAYYNAFVFGIGDTEDEDDANHSLGGYRDIFNVDYASDRDSIRAHSYKNVDDYILKQIYTKNCCEMTHSGFYWMAPEEHYLRTLQIYRNRGWSENADWLAMWNYAFYNSVQGYGNFGYSVRLVFDPFNN